MSRPEKCARCGGPMGAYTMSYFNTDWICLDCSALEQQHPRFAEAQAAEMAATARGEMNFPGIGKPDDL